MIPLLYYCSNIFFINTSAITAWPLLPGWQESPLTPEEPIALTVVFLTDLEMLHPHLVKVYRGDIALCAFLLFGDKSAAFNRLKLVLYFLRGCF